MTRTSYFIGFLLLFLSSFFPTPVSSMQEFTTTLHAHYSVNVSGATIVKNEIRIKNNFSSIYAKQYALEVSSNRIQGVRAYNTDGTALVVETAQTDSETKIALNFADRVVGKDQERVFIIEYMHPEVAIVAGNVLEIDIPKLINPETFQEYDVTIEIPNQFGDPSASTPPTYSLQKSELMNVLKYYKNAKEGINLIFGEKQFYSFELTYNLQNTAISQGVSQIALPPDTPYQRVHYSSIDPMPESIERDADGNWIATFLIASQKELVVKARGYFTIYLKPTLQVSQIIPDNSYTTTQQHWDVSDANVQLLAKSMPDPKSIYDYIVTNFSYSYDRLTQSAQQRYGGAQALKDPTNVLCQEFTDSFISIARAAGIPAREINGYAYTENSRLRPLSLIADVLHAWPEYYDKQKKQWVPIDPTWGNTTGGVDFFTKLDFNHIVFVIHGLSSTRPFPAGVYKIEGKEGKDINIQVENIVPREFMDVSLDVKLDQTAKFGFSTKASVEVKNNTGLAWYDIPVQITAEKGLVVGKDSEKTLEVLLPHQTYTLPIIIESASAFSDQKGQVTVSIAGREVQYEATTKRNPIPIYLGVGLGSATFLAGGILVYWRRR